MTTFDTDVFGAADGGSSGGTGVVKYRPGLMVKYGDEVKSLKDLEVYVRWTKSPEAYTMNKDPADDYLNFKSSTGLCPIGGTTSYIKEDTGNIAPGLVRYKGCLYVYNASTGPYDITDLNYTPYHSVVDEKFIQKLPGDPNSGRALAGVPYVLDHNSAVGDVTPNKNVVFYSNRTTANGQNAALPNDGFYKATGSFLEWLTAEPSPLYLQLLVSVDENTHFFFDQNYRLSRVYVTTDNFATRRAITVDMSLYYNPGTVNILSFVKSTDGRYFLTTGYDGSATVSTANLATPFFYELKFNNDYTAASLIPIYQPLTVADPLSACIEGQVSLLSLKDNKLAVLFGVYQIYIYDINKGTFFEVNRQEKGQSGTGYYNSGGNRTVNQNKMAYDHVNNNLYVVIGPMWQASEIKYILYNTAIPSWQHLTLCRSDAFNNSQYYFFDSIFLKDGSLFGRVIIHGSSVNKANALSNLSYKLTESCIRYSAGNTNNQFVKSFGPTDSTLHITKFGHRYDEIIYSLNNLREMTTTRHHMRYSFTLSNSTSGLEQYMFRIF